jgi:hypothetical protein
VSSQPINRLGIDPDSLDYAGTEIEVEVSNRDTLRKQWEEVMETCLKDQSGQLPGKTIVFAMTKKHAHPAEASNASGQPPACRPSDSMRSVPPQMAPRRH